MIQTNTNNPFVSIIVVTYNSSKYILDALASIKDQNYQNFELIISDDCSTDNTIQICTNWVKANQAFVNFKTTIIKSKTNTGVTANCNRGEIGRAHV